MNKWANGLGPACFGRFNNLLPFSSRFYLPAIGHDYAYATGGTEEDKQIADIQFFERCLEESGKNIFAILFSCIYFIMVYYFGHYFFNYR